MPAGKGRKEHNFFNRILLFDFFSSSLQPGGIYSPEQKPVAPEKTRACPTYRGERREARIVLLIR